MTPVPLPASLTPTEAVRYCQGVFAHAWMVRTFVKHCPESEDFPELMQVARTIFDVARSLESRVGDPSAYFRQLQKKLRRLRESAAQFRVDAPLASDHTNFQQAVLSMDACVAAWEQLVAQQTTVRERTGETAPSVETPS